MSHTPQEILRDIVASDRLILMTGAGISAGATREDGAAVPGWHALLADLRAARSAVRSAPPLDATTRDDVDTLLAAPPGTGTHLIEVASLLSQGWAAFDDAIRDAVRPAEDQPPATQARLDAIHNAMLDTQPRGIMTLNYDDFHERALAQRGLTWMTIVPGVDSDDAKMVAAIRGGLREPFLLKAHGDINGTSPLVLSYETYRNLLGRHPAYRAFVQHLMTNFSLVFVGFGMSDPDFDLFFDTIAMQYGSPVHDHVLLTRKPDDPTAAQEDAARRVALRRRLGVHTLQVDEWAELPDVLRAATEQAGPALAQTLERCVSTDIAERREAHRELRMLGPAGRGVAISELIARIDTPGIDRRVESELVYSLGYISPPPAHRDRVREKLLTIVDTSDHTEVLAHAIDRLGSLATAADVPRLQRRRAALEANPLPPAGAPDPENRAAVYLHRLILRIVASDRA